MGIFRFCIFLKILSEISWEILKIYCNFTMEKRLEKKKEKNYTHKKGKVVGLSKYNILKPRLLNLILSESFKFDQ